MTARGSPEAFSPNCTCRTLMGKGVNVNPCYDAHIMPVRYVRGPGAGVSLSVRNSTGNDATTTVGTPRYRR